VAQSVGSKVIRKNDYDGQTADKGETGVNRRRKVMGLD
jgi:hypothetical protein